MKYSMKRVNFLLITVMLGCATTAFAQQNKDDKEKKDAKGEVLGAERNTKTGDYSRNLQYLFFFAATGFGLFAFFYKEKKRKVN